MTFKFTTISVIIFMTTVVNIIVTIIAWRRRDSKTGLYFSWAMTAITLWTLSAALDYAAVSIPLKLFFAKLEYTAYNISLSFFIMFAITLMGNETLLKNKGVRALLFIMPLSNSLIAWTNDWHKLLWSDFTHNPVADNIVIFHHGPAFAWVAGSGYLAIVILLFIFVRIIRQSSELARQQALLLFWGTLFPLAANTVYQFALPTVEGIDWTSVTFSVTGILFLLALYDTRLLDLTPIARNTMVDLMMDIVLVLDKKHRVIDFNPAAHKLLKIDNNSIGENAASALADWPQIVSLVTGPREQTLPMMLMLNEKAYDIRLTRMENAQGEVYGKMVVLRNITQRHLVEKALQLRSKELQTMVKQLEEEINFRRQAEQQLRKLSRAIEHMASSVIITDPSANIEYVNPGFLELTGYSFDEVIGKNPNMLQSKLTSKETYTELWDTIKNGEEWRGEFINQKKNGEIYWESATISPVRDSAGIITHYVSVKDDITERKQLEEQLEKLATIDSLTNVLNRRELTRILNLELARAHRYRHTTSVVMFDIDHFKTINDRFGHISGDHALQQTAELVKNNIRQTDYFGRYGGDEFIILLPETNLGQARQIAEKICTLIAKSTIISEHKEFEITSSMGIANIDKNETTAEGPSPKFEIIVSLADRALYEAKAAGRNCVKG